MRVIYGPPGTGKTTRLAELVDKFTAEGKTVTVCSYTKTAAEEIAARAGKRKGVVSGTIHSLCFKAAGLHRDMVMSHKDTSKVAAMVGVQYTGQSVMALSDGAGLGDDYLTLHQLAMATGEKYTEVYLRGDRPGYVSQFISFCSAYDSYKAEYGLVDFSDMLWRGIENIDKVATDVLIVDEAQDLSTLQWRFVDAFKAEHKFVAGDDDQSLFSWAGADPERMLNADDFEVLQQSHRIPSNIHVIAERVAKHIKKRKEKEYLPRSEKGSYSVTTLGCALRDVNHGDDVMVLYRINRQNMEVEPTLIDRALPWSGGESILESRWAAAARAWETLRKAYAETDHVTIGDRLMNLFTKTLTPTAAAELAQCKDTVFKKPWHQVMLVPVVVLRYLVAIDKKYGLDVVPTIRLSTIHSAKGKEADRVILINSMATEKILAGYRKNPDSEYRVFYVGVTRAKRHLDVIIGDNPLLF